MKAVCQYEYRSQFKAMLIWALAVGGMGLICLLLFNSMKESMEDMAKSYAAMGAFAKAFGMNVLSIATIKGFFATEVGTIHSLGSAMFTASLAAIVLSKEEDGHTAEFTFTLPLSRQKIITRKFAAIVGLVLTFTLICSFFYLIGFLFLGEKEIYGDFAKYMLFQFLMNLEVAGICFLFSAFCKRNKPGLGISLAMLFYAYDLMARILPDLEKGLFLSPFGYSNAASILSGEPLDRMGIAFGVLVMILCTAAAGMVYTRRDLAS